MRAEPGKRVTISFVCRQEDGSLYNFTNATMLNFVVGQGQTLPSLDAGVVGMEVDEQRTIRLRAKELEEHPFATAADAKASSTESSRALSGYEFAPDSDGDIVILSQPRSRLAQMPLPPTAVLIFHVKMVKVEH